jgi:hypothetical protein
MARTWIVENKWTCKSCNAQNLGRNMNCKNCGAKKAPDVEEQMGSPDDIPVTNTEMLKQANAGANWVCGYCGGQERNLNNECKTCAGPKMADERTPVLTVIGGTVTRKQSGSSTRQEIPYATVVQDGTYNIRPAWASWGGIKEWITENPFKFVIILLSLGATVGLVWFFIWLYTPKFVDTKVATIHWEYISNLRTQEIHHNGEWGHPGGKGFYNEPAFNVSCDSRYFGTEDCHPHDCRPHQVSYDCNCVSYECNCKKSCTNQKNGYSSCSESCSTCNRCRTCSRTEYDTCYDSCPVYRDWCEYDYKEWPVTKTLKTEGDDHKVYWPDLQPGGSDQRLQEIELYQVKLICPGDEFEYKPANLVDFGRFNPGDFWRLQVGKIRGHNIESLRRIRAEKD